MTTAASGARSWRSFHLHYHESLDRLLVECVRPMLAALLADGSIDRFFFVRYRLGGPHLRLRVRPCAGRDGAAEATVLDRAREYIARCPSRATLSAEQIAAINKSVLGLDPDETEAAIYPDNLVREALFRAEVSRYGGPAHFAAALDYFALSSADALRFARAHRDSPRARQLPVLLSMWFREAWQFAGDVDELGQLLSFPAERAGPAMAAIVERGDRQFEQRPRVFEQLVRDQRDQLVRDQIDRPAAGRGAALLAGALQGAPGEVRLRALSSQLHMTANRLGASNAEEVYLGRLLWRAARACGRDALARDLAGRPPVDPDSAASELAELATAAMARIGVAA